MPPDLPLGQRLSPGHNSRMRLSDVIHGRVQRPIRVLLYGIQGIGKTTWASEAPSPIIIPTEDGCGLVDVPRFPKAVTWSDIFTALDTIDHEMPDRKSVVLDTIDWAEPLCWQALVNRANKADIKAIDDFGFGKGYKAALPEWRLLLSRLEHLWSVKGMNVIFLAHSQIKTFKNPEGEDYDRYQLKLHDVAGGAVKEWCDAVLFAKYETFANTDKRKRTRGVSSGDRVVHTEQHAAWDAKNRYDLPPTMPFDWQTFAEAVAAKQPASAAILRARIAKMIASSTDEDLCAKVESACAEAANDARRLARIADKLSAKLNIEQQQQETDQAQGAT